MRLDVRMEHRDVGKLEEIGRITSTASVKRIYVHTKECEVSTDQTLKILDDGSTVSGEMNAQFYRLADEWKRETAHLSSPSMIAEHRVYQEIVQMGLVAIPSILSDVMRAAWLDWGDSAVSRAAT